MSTIINPPNSFSGTSLHGYVRATANSSAGRKITMSTRALAGMKCNRSDDSRGRALQKTLSTFYDKTLKLRDTLGSFSSSDGSLSHLSRTVSISDLDKVSTQVVSGATPAQYEMTIDSLAASQTNISTKLVSEEITDLDEGTYVFILSVGDDSHPLSVTIDKSSTSPDTNKDVLKKLAYAIDSADNDIEAFVTETERKVYSTLSDDLVEDVAYLTVRNKNKGKGSRFSLRDGTETLINTLNIDHVAQNGQVCQYHLNGTQFSSNTNTVSLDNNRVTISVLDTSSGPITITVNGGLEMTQEGLAERISAYNDYASWLDLNSGYVTPAAKTDLIREINALSEDLNSIGLSLNADGRVYGTEKLGIALRNNMSSVRKTLTGENGLFGKIGRRLTKTLENGVTAYGIEESGSSIYSQKVIFEGFKKWNEISMYV